MDIAVLNFGGQYCHLISRRIRALGVDAEILPAETAALELKNAKGIILSGGAASVYGKNAPQLDKNILSLNIPVLGICYGHQLIAHAAGGIVRSADHGEYGITQLKIKNRSKLMKNFPSSTEVWMNHRDIVEALPDNYAVTASTKNSRIAAFASEAKKIYGVQFHPEVTHTELGGEMLKNFVLDICKAPKNYRPKTIDDIVSEAKTVIGNQKAVIALSGGVDSSTAAVLVDKAIGKNLVAVYVDTGLMRENDAVFVRNAFPRLNLKIIDAKETFFKKLKRITDPEQKRKIIGKTFIEIFEDVAKKEHAEVLVQGTIYSDRIESGSARHASVIKSHHNVGGLPEKMNIELYEPLRDLYKDEVRKMAKKLSLPEELVNRHVFPGPGFAVRIVGEVTEEKAGIARKAAQIVEEELKKAGLYEKVWMGFAVLLPIKSVGVQGDERSYKYPIVVRIIESKDAMTANFAKIPYPILEKISTRITNEVRAVNRVVYDISNKPPATMEWE
ncbi:MAG: glutamine-hydrolyzing GMP synthase [Candidatus Aenigmarchaeota archaeon]|nr:glutamine-hydrolyzing GMP synthase [Candidatus Aenigmarchaeota archaeon]